jgi:hypothetical protein
MTRSLSPVLGVCYWLLPWAVVVVTSASIAFVVSGTLAGQASTAAATLQSASNVNSDCIIGPGFVDSRIIEPSRRIACGW